MRMTAENELEQKVLRRLDLPQEHDQHTLTNVIKIKYVNVFIMYDLASNESKLNIQLICAGASLKLKVNSLKVVNLYHQKRDKVGDTVSSGLTSGQETLVDDLKRFDSEVATYNPSISIFSAFSVGPCLPRPPGRFSPSSNFYSFSETVTHLSFLLLFC